MSGVHRPGAPRSGRVHRYVRGLRFNSQLQYQVFDARHRRAWAALPMPWLYSPPGDDGGRLCVLQAASVLTKTRAYELPGPVPAPSDARELADWCSRLEFSISACVQEVLAATLGKMVGNVIRAGGACGLQLEADGESRWVFVSGIEDAAGEDVGGARALLLIDPKVPSAWIAGYNARIELRARPARDAPHGSARYWQSIHGGQLLARPTTLLTVLPSGV